MSDLNEERTKRGKQAIRLHPDYPGGIDSDTAASDIIADVLHCIIGESYSDENQARAAQLLQRALHTWVTDAEDSEVQQ